MKVWKKNLVAAAILVAVCAGIYVNWKYTEDQAVMNFADTLDEVICGHLAALNTQQAVLPVSG